MSDRCSVSGRTDGGSSSPSAATAAQASSHRLGCAGESCATSASALAGSARRASARRAASRIEASGPARAPISGAVAARSPMNPSECAACSPIPAERSGELLGQRGGRLARRRCRPRRARTPAERRARRRRGPRSAPPRRAANRPYPASRRRPGVLRVVPPPVSFRSGEIVPTGPLDTSRPSTSFVRSLPSSWTAFQQHQRDAAQDVRQQKHRL